MSDPRTIPDPPNTTWDPRDPNLPAEFKELAAEILSDSTSDATSTDEPSPKPTFG